MLVIFHTCEQNGCDEKAIECSLNDDEDSKFYYCPEHCYQNGFCFGCGNFFSGMEDFDFENPTHLCFNCRTEIEEEDEEIPSYPDLGEPFECEP